MNKVLIIIGTRPEANKMAPLVHALRQSNVLEPLVCLTSQHRELVQDSLRLFEIEADIDLDIMSTNQTPCDVAARVITGVDQAIRRLRPHWLLAQGDTTTTLAATLAGAYNQVRVGHVEAGLRTNDRANPFPEEMNRRAATVFADYHFAPTKITRQNLLREGIPAHKILVTGNTGIDAFKWMLNRLKASTALRDSVIMDLPTIDPQHKLIVVTAHRRESFGEGLRNICQALRLIAEMRDDVQIIFPVHPNPNVRKEVSSVLWPVASPKTRALPPWSDRLALIQPISYPAITYLLGQCAFVLTDSGGIQEEAASIGKPVLVLRDVTERPEGVEAGVAKIVGTRIDIIVNHVIKLLDDNSFYESMAKVTHIYGDGYAAQRINLKLEEQIKLNRKCL